MKRLLLALSIIGFMSCQETAYTEQCPVSLDLVEWEECVLNADGYKDIEFTHSVKETSQEIAFQCGGNPAKGRIFKATAPNGENGYWGICGVQNENYRIIKVAIKN